ncbi:MAG: hypothetical protein K8U03_17060 [Planctomycetia bacterium]|nr:hypothetical protein [Planctomycetia bacterium]
MIATVGYDATGEKPTAVLETSGLRVVFLRRNDRYAHRIEVWDSRENGWSIALESREGSDEEPWPPSPPFQQLHVEKRAAGDVVLLVGMAGRSHWSAAVEVCEVRKVLKFDVAVRIQAVPEQLGTAYAICASAAAGRLVVAGESGTEIGSGFTLGPASIEKSPPPATICWKYSLGLRDVD